MNEFYEVYVGNLSVATTHQNLRGLFSKVGEVVSTWISRRYEEFTYGFVKFRYFDDARNAIKNFNNANLDGSIIKVNLSKKCEQKLAETVKKKRDGSLLLELPKRTKRKEVTKRDIGDKLLRDSILKTNDRNFVVDFVSAFKEIEDDRPNLNYNTCEIIKTEPEETNLQTLEDIVLRYYKPARQKKKIEIDIDLSNNKVLDSATNAKFFNIAF